MYDCATTLTEARLSEGGATKFKLNRGYLANLIEERKTEYDVKESIPENVIQKIGSNEEITTQSILALGLPLQQLKQYL